MNDAPCKNCKDRTVEPNCHITCQKYIEFKKKRDKDLETIRISKQKYRY